MGFAQINQNRADDRINQIILITDGRTYGDEILCEDLSDQAKALGVGISALGIGYKWNDVFLDQLASKTGGICKYISNVHEIRNSILSEITRLGSSLTEHITYNYSIPEGVELRSAFRMQPDVTPLIIQSPLSLGRMPEQGILRFMIELVINNLPVTQGAFNLVKGLINYRVASSPHHGNHIQRLDLIRQITLAPGNESPPQVIIDALSMLSLYRMQERARDEMHKGDVSSATRHLQILATHLLNKGAGKLADAVLDEVKHIELTQSFSEDGEKRIKYGTRALLLPARTEESQ
jgi:Ca-activated chloride channel family protein